MGLAWAMVGMRELVHLHRMKNVAFYFGVGLLFTHEMDAMPNHEWRLLSILNSLKESSAELVFLIAHVPIFGLTIAFIGSVNQKTRLLAQRIASGFLIVHAILHFTLAGQASYEFESMLSNVLIYGAALCGVGYFFAAALEAEP